MIILKIFTGALLAILASSAYGHIPKKHADLLLEVRQINQDTALQKITLTNAAFLENTYDGGGKLTGYYKNEKIQKISRTIGLSNGINIDDYYFENGQLVFIHSLFNAFVIDDHTRELNYNKTVTNFTGRYYFRNDKLIDNESTGHSRFETNGMDVESALIAETKQNIILLKKEKERRKSKRNST
jgi:hypothetical protein